MRTFARAAAPAVPAASAAAASAAAWESAAEGLLIIVAALVAGAVGFGSVCLAADRCAADDACLRTSDLHGDGVCSFTNIVGLAADRLYTLHNDQSLQNLAALTRGVCAPGERMQLNARTNQAECVFQSSWPDALTAEVFGADDASSFHQKYCGAWLDSGGSLLYGSVEYLSFHDEDAFAEAVRAAAAEGFASPRLRGTDAGKLHATCVSTVLAGNAGIRASAVAAYQYLVAQFEADVSSSAAALRSLGVLVAHSCPAPVRIGAALGGFGFLLTAVSGAAFESGELAAALFVVEESKETQEHAEEANAALNALAGTAPPATLDTYGHVIEGATGREDHDHVVLSAESAELLDAFAALAAAGDAAQTRAYLAGLAAMCALALDASLDTDLASTSSGVLATTALTRLQTTLPNATALGRIQRTERGVPLSDASNETLMEAVAISLAQLRALPVGDPDADCTALVQYVMPDRMDQMEFSRVVSPALYDDLQILVETMRSAVQTVVTTHSSITAVLSNPATVASGVAQTVFRIPGAPRGSWAGLPHDLPQAELSSDDGPLKMALKQARAVWLSRISDLVFDSADHCSGPPFYDALETNAYIFPFSYCSYLLLGVLRHPWAGERFDNASLSSRIGFVIAHELAHVSLTTQWSFAGASALLGRYSSVSLYSEALADIVAALAIIESGMATAAQVCAHASQTWCARLPFGWQPSSTAIHPPPNERGDAICLTLQDLGYTV